MEKGQTVEVRIEDMSHEGQGIGRADGLVVFVPGTVVGDVAKAELTKVKKYVRNGSIITFHDSLRSEENLKYALPRAIEWLLEQGYEFKVFE